MPIVTYTIYVIQLLVLLVKSFLNLCNQKVLS